MDTTIKKLRRIPSSKMINREIVLSGKICTLVLGHLDPDGVTDMLILSWPSIKEQNLTLVAFYGKAQAKGEANQTTLS